VQGDNVQGNGVQDDSIAVPPLDTLRPRPNWCTGRSHAVREVLQRDDSGRTRPGAVESRVVNAGGRRGEGNGKCNPNTSRPRSSRWRRSGYGVSSSEKIRCSQARRTPFTHAEVKAGATRRESDARRRTDGRLSSFPQAVDAGAEQK
jgi:hypothetical protein